MSVMAMNVKQRNESCLETVVTTLTYLGQVLDNQGQGSNRLAYVRHSCAPLHAFKFSDKFRWKLCLNDIARFDHTVLRYVNSK